MDIRLADQQDVPQLARLLWMHAAPEEQARQSVEAFAVDLAGWCAGHSDSHFAFVAQDADCEIVGMAWLALLPRVPRPGTTTRLSADLQSVFVVPDHRGKGIGSALVEATADHAARLGAGRVTVSSSRRAVPVYERLGFAPSRRLLQTPAQD
jgi:GNAT superfamily N-acetyltransferase